jgi:chromosome segregation ATPase
MQDDEVKEQLEALRGALKKLEESNVNLNKRNKKLVRENETLTGEVDAHKSVVLQLKEKFDAVNTSNAKLLYINRTLDCGSLNERQKKSIVEAIAKAEDAKEAKVIYETLQNTVETKKEKSPESLSEAVSRRSSLLVRSREEKKTTSADIFAERMQRLAGINKQN